MIVVVRRPISFEDKVRWCEKRTHQQHVQYHPPRKSLHSRANATNVNMPRSTAVCLAVSIMIPVAIVVFVQGTRGLCWASRVVSIDQVLTGFYPSSQSEPVLLML